LPVFISLYIIEKGGKKRGKKGKKETGNEMKKGEILWAYSLWGS
jgi:hypothetical protein